MQNTLSFMGLFCKGNIHDWLGRAVSWWPYYLFSWCAIRSNYLSQFLLLSTFVGRLRDPQVCFHISCTDHFSFVVFVFSLMLYRIDVLYICFTIWFIYPSNYQLQLIPLIVYFCRSPLWPQHMWSHVCIKWSYITYNCLFIIYYILTTAGYHLSLVVIYAKFMTLQT